MSIHTVITSDRTQFRNYFSDGITIPSNANVALTKCAIDIPIFIQTVLKVPPILPADRNDPFLQVNIDGIRKTISFTEFFNAVVSYPSVVNFATGVERDLTIGEFYGGDYEFFLNNRLYLSQDGQTVNIKPNIMWVLAKVISDRYEFYDCTDCTHYDEDYCGVPDTQSLIGNFAAGAVDYSQSYVRAIQPNEYKLNVAYTPGAVTAKTITDSNFVENDVVTWTIGGTGNRLTSVGGVAVNVAYDNSSDVDLNGGFMVVTPTIAATGIAAFGYSLMSHGSGVGDVYIPKAYTTIDLATPIIDIGIQFETSGVHHVFKIIDGQQQLIHYNGVDFDTQNITKFRPYDAVSAFSNANDRFAIVCRRGNIINNSYEFVFDIKMGMGADISTYNTIYTSTKTLNTPAIQMVPVFLSNAVANNIFNDIEYVRTGVDTLAQKNGLTNLTGYKFNTVEIGVGADNYVAEADIRDFVNGMGLNYYSGSLNTKEPFNVSYEGTPLNKVISWKPAMNTYQDSRALITYYWLGELKLSNIFNYSNVVNTWLVNQTSALTDLPKYLNVLLLNHTNKSYSGSFISAVNTLTNQSFLGFSEGQDKVVGTVPVVVDSNISQILNINYEVYNPYYRPLGNPTPFVTNDFIIEISYKDFRSDEKKFINDIDGLLKVELNFTKSNKQNIKRITETNELVPLI